MELAAELSPRLRVMVVDDFEIVRDGIKALLADAEGIQVVGEAGTVRDAVTRAAALEPDVIVMDVRLTDGSGIDATREILASRPGTRVLMLTTYSDDDAMLASIMAGAAGYVLKQVRGGDLVRAIRTVGAGRNLLDAAVTRGVLDRIRQGKHLRGDLRLGRLSSQEERVLTEVAEGKTNRQIAESLQLAEKTVKNYISSILGKLEVSRRAEAASYLVRHTSLPA